MIFYNLQVTEPLRSGWMLQVNYSCLRMSKTERLVLIKMLKTVLR